MLRYLKLCKTTMVKITVMTVAFQTQQKIFKNDLEMSVVFVWRVCFNHDQWPGKNGRKRGGEEGLIEIRFYNSLSDITEVLRPTNNN